MGGGVESFQSRTVASREAEKTAFGVGKATARTYRQQIAWLVKYVAATVMLILRSPYIIAMAFQRCGELEVRHT